jgi:hypothetical protein
MASITLRVNGQSRTADVDPATPLLYVLRNDLDLHGPRFGCGLSQCGLCTVIIGGNAVRSCILTVSAVQGAEITTLEGWPPTASSTAAAGVDRRAGAGVRILPERTALTARRCSTESDAHRCRDSAGYGGRVVRRAVMHYRIQAAIKRASRTIAAARVAGEVIA